jgi:hypothetical protein
MELQDIINEFDVHFADLQNKKQFARLFFEIDRVKLYELIKEILIEWIKTYAAEKIEKTNLQDFFYLQIIVGLIKLKFTKGSSNPDKIDQLIYKLLEYYFHLNEGKPNDRKIHFKIENYFNNGRILRKESLRKEYRSDPHGHQLSILQLIADDLNLKYGPGGKIFLNKTYLEHGNQCIVFNCCDLYFKLYELKTGKDAVLIDPDDYNKEIEKTGTDETDHSNRAENISIAKLSILFLPYDDREIVLLRFGFPHGNSNMAHETIAALKRLISTGEHTTNGVIRNMFLEAQENLNQLVNTFKTVLMIGTQDDILHRYHEKIEYKPFKKSEDVYAYHEKNSFFLSLGYTQFYFQMLPVAQESILKWYLTNKFPGISANVVNTCVILFFKNLNAEERAIVCLEKFFKHPTEKVVAHCENNMELLQVLMPTINVETVAVFTNGLQKLIPFRDSAFEKWNRIKP